MICSETREYLFAFLDSELDAPLSIELQRHVERCHDCAREVEIERTIKRQLSASLEPQSTEYALDEGALKLAMASAQGPTRRAVRRIRQTTMALGRPRVAGLLAAAAAILIVLTSMWLIGPRGESGRLRERFAVLVVDDFEHFLEEGQHLQIASSDPGIVTDWLRTRTKLDVVLPALDSPDCRLIGGRKCKIDGRTAAFAIYEVEGSLTSIVAVADEGDAAHDERRYMWNLEGMEEIHSGDRAYWVDSCKGYTVVAWKQAGMTYAAVSTVSKEKILSLMIGGLHEGD